MNIVGRRCVDQLRDCSILSDYSDISSVVFFRKILIFNYQKVDSCFQALFLAEKIIHLFELKIKLAPVELFFPIYALMDEKLRDFFTSIA